MKDILRGKNWRIHHGDAITHMATLPAACFDFAVFSPPFPSVYAYTSKAEDIGNSEDVKGEAKLHLSFFFRQFARTVKPGRAIVVHCTQIVRMKRNGGESGVFDFRGMLVRLAERAGLVFEYDWMVRVNPQSQAIRSRSRELQFAGLESDRARSRGALPMYLLKFMAPGGNAVAVDSEGEVSRNDWIKWAEPCWDDIIETDTLNVVEGRGEDDTRHICPLQLEIIRRLTLLYTNPGEVVFSPFAGIGSEGYIALGGKSPKTSKRIYYPRRFYGCELKDEYYEAARINCRRAESQDSEERQSSLFGALDTKEAFDPESEHWGSMVSPVAEIE